jgi:hypothetical protein
VAAAWERFLTVADRKKEVTDADLMTIAGEVARSA